MPATFICPNCGRIGSVKKEIPRGAKVRCPGCQTLFMPDAVQEAPSDQELSERQAEDFLGISINGAAPAPEPLFAILVEDDEPISNGVVPPKHSSIANVSPPPILQQPPPIRPATSTAPIEEALPPTRALNDCVAHTRYQPEA
jgi:hypothetical protein